MKIRILVPNGEGAPPDPLMRWNLLRDSVLTLTHSMTHWHITRVYDSWSKEFVERHLTDGQLVEGQQYLKVTFQGVCKILHRKTET